MGSYGDQVRQALLDSAEELFATYGVDAVSNRRIAEHAGNANHSAVNYHFGGRDELVRATLLRYSEDAGHRRRELVNRLGSDPGLRDLLSCLIIPATEQLGSLPVPSWRARFLQQMRTVPSMVETVAATTTTDPYIDDLIRRVRACVSDLPDSVMTGRAWLLGRLVIDACADYEERLEREALAANWTGFAYFLIDACAGMLEAPATSAGDFLNARDASAWT